MSDRDGLRSTLLKEADLHGLAEEFRKQIYNRLEAGINMPSVHKIVPKIKPTAKMIKFMQEMIHKYSYDDSAVCLWYGMLGLLAQEGSSRSTKIIKEYVQREDKKGNPFLTRLMSRLLDHVGNGKEIKELTRFYTEIADRMVEQSELGRLAKHLQLSPKKMDWEWNLHFAAGEPPAYFGAAHDGPWVRVVLVPEYLTRPWQIFVLDRAYGKSLISGPTGEMSTNELAVPALANFLDFPVWIGRVAKKLNVDFDFQKTKFFGPRSSKDKQKIIKWISSS